MMFATLLLLRALAGDALAACPASAADVRTEVEGAYASYVALDVDAFGPRASAALEAATCVTEAISPADAARLHLVLALKAWVGRDGAGLIAGMKGVRAADPTATLDEQVAPAGGRVRVFWDTAGGPSTGRVVPLPTAGGLTWRVDGHETDLPVLPLERAALVQRFEADGRLAGTWYFATGGQLATVAPETTVVAAPAPLPPAPTLPRTPLLGPPSRKLALGSVVAAGAGAAGLWVAVQARDEYRGADLSAGPLDDLDQRNRVSGIAGWSAIGVSGALLGAALVVHRW